MKKYFKFFSVALAAFMALGSLALVSCDKENDVINPQTSMDDPSLKTTTPPTPTPDARFLINEVFHDSMGRCWHIKGSGKWLNVNGGRNGVHLDIKFTDRGGSGTYYYKGEAVWCNPSVEVPIPFTLIPDEGAPEPSRLVWFVMREYSWHLLYDNGQGSAKQVAQQVPIELQNFTDSNGTTWTVWGGYYELLGRRAIKFDIKFYPTFSANRVAIRHYVGTVTFDLNGNCEITGGDFRMTTEIKDFLRDFARYWLNH